MARRRRRKTHGRFRRIADWCGEWMLDHGRVVVRTLGITALLVCVLGVGRYGSVRLEAHVLEMISNRTVPQAVFVDLPHSLSPLVRSDLSQSISDLLGRDWTDSQLCRLMALRLADVGWVQKVNHVRRDATGRFEISCNYRAPVAMVQQGSSFFLVDRHNTRLPGKYEFDPDWTLIQGVRAPAPAAGQQWIGEDLRCGIDVVESLAFEGLHPHISGILVDNVGGRSNPAASHVTLATERSGGRILWGSAPGKELEENSIEQKLAILRENLRSTGRIDAGHTIIDISVFPDRFTIVGAG